MSHYYRCIKCNKEREEYGVVRPVCCENPMEKYFKKAPNTLITPDNAAAGDKMGYYGIDIVTGDGITEHTDVSNKPGNI